MQLSTFELFKWSRYYFSFMVDGSSDYFIIFHLGNVQSLLQPYLNINIKYMCVCICVNIIYNCCYLDQGSQTQITWGPLEAVSG